MNPKIVDVIDAFLDKFMREHQNLALRSGNYKPNEIANIMNQDRTVIKMFLLYVKEQMEGQATYAQGDQETTKKRSGDNKRNSKRKKA